MSADEPEAYGPMTCPRERRPGDGTKPHDHFCLNNAANLKPNYHVCEHCGLVWEELKKPWVPRR
jgi:hypothetical protein